MDKMMLIGGPVVAVIVATWGYVQGFMSKLRSLALVTVEVDKGLSDALCLFCWKKMRRLSLGDRFFTSNKTYVQPLSRYQRVGLEHLSPGGAVLLYGWVPVFVRSSVAREDKPFSFTVLRGTIDVDKLLIDALEMHNERVFSGYKRSRFFITREFGSVGSALAAQNTAPSPTAEDTNDSLDVINKRLLKWSPDQLGEPVHKTGRAFEFLSFPSGVWSAVEDAERWLKSERWYKEKGIPWKRGWLLYGPPGTGKTSLVRSIGEHLDVPVTVFSVSTFTDKEFQREWDSLKNRVPCIALLEDIDTVFDGRENVARESACGKPLSFETLLNAIDGIQNTDGIFTIVTTNHVEKLDPALGRPVSGDEVSSRPGRIDRAIKLDVMREPERLELAKRILSDCPEHVEKLVNEGDGETPAQFQDRCARVALSEYWRAQR